MSPRRFQVSPVTEISSSRETFRSTIHFWSVVSSLKLKMFPLAWRTFHSRGFSGPAGAGCAGGSSTWPPSSGLTGTVTTSAFFFTLKTWLHWVHFTVTPASVIRASSNSYSVLHRSQRTSMNRISSG